MNRLYWIIFLTVFALSGHAERTTPIRDVRAKIDSMQHVLHQHRDSARLEIKAYRDSVRDVHRHAPVDMPHHLRVGWGDQLFETLMWRDLGHYSYLPEDYEAKYNEKFRYTQHWFVEYLYRLNYRYSFGLLMDYSGVIWDSVLRYCANGTFFLLPPRICLPLFCNWSWFEYQYRYRIGLQRA